MPHGDHTAPADEDGVAISVIVPARNEAETIGVCLRSLAKQHLPREAYEIIVVDGDSSDETCAIAGRHADTVVAQVRRGIGGARKDGVDAASGRVLVFTDADTSPAPTWLAAIAENLLVGGYDASTGPTRFCERTVRSEILQIWRKQYHLYHVFNYYRLIGSNIAITRQAYDRVSGHRDISLLEDYDLSLRMFREGSILCNYDPRQIVYTSSRRICNLFSYMLVYLYGQYHYHVTRDYARLLQYPRFDEMSLKVMLERLAEDPEE
ncbi:glycosyltransferase [Methanoculleus taiwanensis]|uniref:glycosyltransferase n=1 Tax=Methanoculleus taiwanensis TaxID=1550565 RepID=UPI000FFE60B2|nr:glycosyltransferase [Methanoculleus taiwanensis]